MKPAILLADDSPTIQRLVTQTFADADFEVISVSNGDAAIRKFEELHPLLVLADIYMPGRNGYEVCAYIKNHAHLAYTPVILLAGAFDVFDDESAKQAGASAHMAKPFEPQALADLVTSLLEERIRNIEAAAGASSDDGEDLLGLRELFRPVPSGITRPVSVSDEEIERIADRVIQKLSVRREELKRQS